MRGLTLLITEGVSMEILGVISVVLFSFEDIDIIVRSMVFNSKNVKT